MSSTSPPYEIMVDGFSADHFRVHSLHGKEALSEAWSFDVTVTGEEGEGAERATLGQRATVVFNVGPAPRVFYGIVKGAELLEVHHADHSQKLRLRVVPRFAMLRRKRRSRIFQNLRVTDIVAGVLREAGIVTRFQLTRAYPVREHVTQYAESDAEFVERLLAEAGIFYYFFAGGPVDPSAFALDAAVGAAASAGSAIAGAALGSDVGALVGSAASLAETLIPGDTLICADDATCYPAMNGDDPAALAASTAAALAPALGDALGVGGGVAGAAIGAASAVVSAVITGATTGAGDVPVLRFLANEDAYVAKSDKVTRFTVHNAVRSSAATFRDFDPDRPAVRLQSSAVSTQPFPPGPFDIAAEVLATVENVVGAAASALPAEAAGVLGVVDTAISTAGSIANQIGAATGQRVPMEVYDHHSPFLFPKWSFANDEAPRMLRQERRRASIATGVSGCSDLAPGRRIALAGHPAHQLDGTWAVVAVEHRGETYAESGRKWNVYSNQFECAPAEMTYPPARPERECVQVALTATVVGPPGEEIWVDPIGRIKVQFHWDREGRYDDKSSCWIRVMQAWAGAGWGHQFIPRVGQEVIVLFEAGDPDRPLVTGAVYNGTHPPPFKLPQEKARSGIRTSTYPGGQGFNEVSFNDARGSEQVIIHAQRDMYEVVEHDHQTDVGGNQAQVVRGSQKEAIEQDQHLTVAVDRTEVVGRELKSKVGADRTTTISRNDALSVGGDASASVSGHYGLDVKGSSSVTVGSGDDGGQSDHYVNGSASIGAAERLVLRAEKAVVIQCGDTVITLTPDELKLIAKSIKGEGGGISLCGDGPSLEMGKDVQVFSKSITMYAEKSTVELGENASVKGEKVQLKSNQAPPSPAGSDDKKDTQPFKCQFSDFNLKPYSGKTYHLRADGLKTEGKTDNEGFVTATVPKDVKQVVVTVWIDEYPTGRRKTYTLTQAELPAASAPMGAQKRLKHLGYFSGEPTDELTDDAKNAIAWFQQDHKESHGIEPTGELDGPTAGALEDVHGS